MRIWLALQKEQKKRELNPYKMDIAWNYSTKLSTTNAAPAAKAVECFSTFQHKIQIDPFEHLSCQFFFFAMHCLTKCLQVPFNIALFFHKSNWKIETRENEWRTISGDFFQQKKQFLKTSEIACQSEFIE